MTDLQEVAKTIVNQIMAIDKWALGAWGYNKPMVYTKDGKPTLGFRCSGTKVRKGGFCEISLNEAQDLYEVKLFRIIGLNQTTLGAKTEVFWEDLVNVCDELIG